MLNDVYELSVTVCMIVVYVNFIVEKIYKRHVDYTKSVEQFTSEKNFEDKVSAVLFLQQSRTYDMFLLLICWFGWEEKLGFCAKLVENMSTRPSEVGTRCNE